LTKEKANAAISAKDANGGTSRGEVREFLLLVRAKGKDRIKVPCVRERACAAEKGRKLKVDSIYLAGKLPVYQSRRKGRVLLRRKKICHLKTHIERDESSAELLDEGAEAHS